MLRPCSKASTNLEALRQCEQLRPPQQPQGLSPSDHAPLLWRPPSRVKCDRFVDCTHLSFVLNDPCEIPVGTMRVRGCIQGTTWRRQSLCVGNAELSVLVNMGFTNTFMLVSVRVPDWMGAEGLPVAICWLSIDEKNRQSLRGRRGV